VQNRRFRSVKSIAIPPIARHGKRQGMAISFYRVIISITLIAFLSQNLVWAYPTDTLAPNAMIEKSDGTEEFDQYMLKQWEIFSSRAERCEDAEADIAEALWRKKLITEDVYRRFVRMQEAFGSERAAALAQEYRKNHPDTLDMAVGPGSVDPEIQQAIDAFVQKPLGLPAGSVSSDVAAQLMENPTNPDHMVKALTRAIEAIPVPGGKKGKAIAREKQKARQTLEAKKVRLCRQLNDQIRAAQRRIEQKAAKHVPSLAQAETRSPAGRRRVIPGVTRPNEDFTPGQLAAREKAVERAIEIMRADMPRINADTLGFLRSFQTPTPMGQDAHSSIWLRCVVVIRKIAQDDIAKGIPEFDALRVELDKPTPKQVIIGEILNDIFLEWGYFFDFRQFSMVIGRRRVPPIPILSVARVYDVNMEDINVLDNNVLLTVISLGDSVVDDFKGEQDIAISLPDTKIGGRMCLVVSDVAIRQRLGEYYELRKWVSLPEKSRPELPRELALRYLTKDGLSNAVLFALLRRQWPDSEFSQCLERGGKRRFIDDNFRPYKENAIKKHEAVHILVEAYTDEVQSEKLTYLFDVSHSFDAGRSYRWLRVFSMVQALSGPGAQAAHASAADWLFQVVLSDIGAIPAGPGVGMQAKLQALSGMDENLLGTRCRQQLDHLRAFSEKEHEVAQAHPLPAAQEALLKDLRQSGAQLHTQDLIEIVDALAGIPDTYLTASPAELQSQVQLTLASTSHSLLSAKQIEILATYLRGQPPQAGAIARGKTSLEIFERMLNEADEKGPEEAGYFEVVEGGSSEIANRLAGDMQAIRSRTRGAHPGIWDAVRKTAAVYKIVRMPIVLPEGVEDDYIVDLNSQDRTRMADGRPRVTDEMREKIRNIFGTDNVLFISDAVFECGNASVRQELIAHAHCCVRLRHEQAIDVQREIWRENRVDESDRKGDAGRYIRHKINREQDPNIPELPEVQAAAVTPFPGLPSFTAFSVGEFGDEIFGSRYTGRKDSMRMLFAGGPLNQPPFFTRLEISPNITPAHEFSNADYTKAIGEVAEAIASGASSTVTLPLILKPIGGQLSCGVCVITRTEPGKVTITLSLGSPERASDAEKYNFLARIQKGKFKDRIIEPEGENVAQVTLDAGEDNIAEVIRHLCETIFRRGAETGHAHLMIETFMDAVRVRNDNLDPEPGKPYKRYAYETDLYVEGNLLTGKADLITGEWHGRVGISDFFSTFGGRELAAHEVFEPLYEQCVPQEILDDEAAFRDYRVRFREHVNRTLLAAFRHFSDRLKEAGIIVDVDVGIRFDLGWLMPEKEGEFPTPYLIEPHIGYTGYGNMTQHSVFHVASSGVPRGQETTSRQLAETDYYWHKLGHFVSDTYTPGYADLVTRNFIAAAILGEANNGLSPEDAITEITEHLQRTGKAGPTEAGEEARGYVENVKIGPDDLDLVHLPPTPLTPPPSVTNFGTAGTYNAEFDAKTSAFVAENIDGAIDIAVTDNVVENPDAVPADILERLDQYIEANPFGEGTYHLFLFDTAKKDPKYGTDPFTLVDEGEEKVYCHAGTGGEFTDSKRRSVYMPIPLLRALIASNSNSLNLIMEEEVTHAREKVDDIRTPERFNDEKALKLARLQWLIADYETSREELDNSTMLSRLDEFTTMSRRHFVKLSGAAVAGTPALSNVMFEKALETAGPGVREFFDLIRPAVQARSEIRHYQMGDLAETLTGRLTNLESLIVGDNRNVWARREKVYVVIGDYTEHARSVSRDRIKVNARCLEKLYSFLRGEGSIQELEEAERASGILGDFCDIRAQGVSQSQSDFRAYPPEVRARALMHVLQREIALEHRALTTILNPGVRMMHRRAASASAELEKIEAEEAPIKEAAERKEQRQRAELRKLRVNLQFSPERRQGWAESLVGQLKALPEGQRLGLVLDTSIGNINDHANGLIQEIEDLAEREGLSGKLDIITGQGAELRSRVNIYLREGKKKKEKRIVRGVIHTRDQRSYEVQFGKNEDYKDKIKLVAVDDEKIQNPEREDSASAHYVPILPIIEASLTGEVGPIPNTKTESTEEGIVRSIIKLLPAEAPIPFHDLDSMFEEDKEFLKNA